MAADGKGPSHTRIIPQTELYEPDDLSGALHLS